MLHGSTFAFALRIVISRGTSPSLCLPLTPPLFPSHSDASAIGIFSPARRSSDDGEKETERKGKTTNREGEKESHQEPPLWDATCLRLYFHMPTQCTGPSRNCHTNCRLFSNDPEATMYRVQAYRPGVTVPVDHDRSSVPSLTRTTTAGGKTITWKRKKTRIAILYCMIRI